MNGKKITNSRSRENVKMKLVVCFLIICLSVSLVPLHLFSVRAATGIDIWSMSSYYNVFKDYTKDGDAKGNASEGVRQTAELVMAKNEYEGTQVVLRSQSAFTVESITISDLISGNNVIASRDENGYENFSYNLVEYWLSNNSSDENGQNNARWIDGYYNVNSEKGDVGVAGLAGLEAGINADYFPDSLSNEKSFRIPANETHAVLVTYFVPEDAVSGYYTGNITVHTNRGDKVLPVAVDVVDVVVPEADNSAFEFEFWYMTTQFWKQGKAPLDTVSPMLGEETEKYSDQWWTIMDDMITILKRNRVNVLYVLPWQMIVDAPGTKIEGDDPDTYQYTFDFSVMEEFMQFFIERLPIKRIAANHLCLSMSQNLYVLDKDADGTIYTRRGVSYADPQGSNYLEQYLQQLGEMLVKNGWSDMWLQHISDEPPPSIGEAYKTMGALIKQYIPGAIYGDAYNTSSTCEVLVAAGAEFLSPYINFYNDETAKYKELQEQGYIVYPYTMYGPHAKALNRLFDKPVWNMRSLAWLSYKWGTPGHLHANANTWYYDFNVNKQPEDWDLRLKEPALQDYKGDLMTMYPDIENQTVKSSIRFEAIRDAGEEFEMLALAGGKDESYAKRMANSVASGLRSYEDDPEMLKAYRDRLYKDTESLLKDEGLYSADMDTMAATNGTVDIYLREKPSVLLFETDFILSVSEDGNQYDEIEITDFSFDGNKRVHLTFDGIAPTIYNKTITVRVTTKDGNYQEDVIFLKNIAAPSPTTIYNFEDSSNLLKDSSGNNKHGTAGNSGKVTYTPDGKNGGAMYFDGTQTVAESPKTAAGVVNIANSFTASLWVNFDATCSFGAGGQPGLLVQTGANGRGWLYAENSSAAVGPGAGTGTGGVPRFRSYFGGGNDTLTSNTIIETGVWYKIDMVFEAQGSNMKQSLYVNGVFDTSVNSNTVSSYTANVVIGNHKSNQKPFKGMMDDITFYQKALSAEEVANNYSGSNRIIDIEQLQNFKVATGTTLALETIATLDNDKKITIPLTYTGDYNKDVDGSYTLTLTAVTAGYELADQVVATYSITVEVGVAVKEFILPQNKQVEKGQPHGLPSMISAKFTSENTMDMPVTYVGHYDSNTLGTYLLIGTIDTGEFPLIAGLSNTFEVEIEVVFVKKDQSITFNELPQKAFNDASFELTAFSSSGLEISYTSSDSSIASIDRNIVTIHKVGKVIITASQAGNDDFNAATPVERALIIEKANQTITFDRLPESVADDSEDIVLNATSTSGLEVTFISNNEGVASILDGKLVVHKAGVVVIIAMQSGSGEYHQAKVISQTLVITSSAPVEPLKDQTITFERLPESVADNSEDIVLNATSTSGLEVTFISSNEEVASISGGKLVVHKAGVVVIIAMQGGNEEYNAAQSVLQTLVVTSSEPDKPLKDQTITFEKLPESVADNSGDIALNATSTSGLEVTFISSNEGVASISGGKLVVHKAGVVVIIAMQGGNGEYYAAKPVMQTLVVTSSAPDKPLKDQTITFERLPESVADNSGDIALNATSTSGLNVTFISSNEEVASISGGKLVVHKAGVVVIIAMQGGSGEYNAAKPVMQTLVVTSSDVPDPADEKTDNKSGLATAITVTAIVSVVATSGLMVLGYVIITKRRKKVK